MVLPLILIAWLSLSLLAVCMCRMAARGDAAPARREPASGGKLHIVRAVRRTPAATPERLTSHGARARGARCEAGS